MNYAGLDRQLKAMVQISSVIFLTIFCDRDRMGWIDIASVTAIIDKALVFGSSGKLRSMFSYNNGCKRSHLDTVSQTLLFCYIQYKEEKIFAAVGAVGGLGVGAGFA